MSTPDISFLFYIYYFIFVCTFFLEFNTSFLRKIYGYTVIISFFFYLNRYLVLLAQFVVYCIIKDTSMHFVVFLFSYISYPLVIVVIRINVSIFYSIYMLYHVSDLSIKLNRANALFKMRYVSLKILRSIYFALF